MLVKKSKKTITLFFQKNLKVDYQIKDLQILTDEKWSGFVIEQVLSNALKYTKKEVLLFIMKVKSFIFKTVVLVLKKVIYQCFFEKGFEGFQGRNDKKASGLGLYLCKIFF